MLNKKHVFKVLLTGIILLAPYVFAYQYSFIKIDALKIAANGSVDISTGKGYKVGLVAFSGVDSYCAHGICSFSNLTTNPAPLHTQINSYEPMSGTCISCGINKSKQLLATASGQKYIVVLSDGVPNSCASIDGGSCTDSRGRQESLQQAANAFAQGIKVYAIALGDDANDTFLKNLSDTGGGKFYNVSCTSSSNRYTGTSRKTRRLTTLYLFPTYREAWIPNCPTTARLRQQLRPPHPLPRRFLTVLRPRALRSIQATTR